MTKYLIKRIIMIIPVVLGVLLVLFALLYFIPGSRVRMMPVYSNGDALDSVYRFFNAGSNLLTQFIRYCYNVFTKFDFGSTGSRSRWLEIELGYRTRNTLLLLFTGVGVTIIFGIPIGVLSAVNKDSVGDRIGNTITLFVSSIPNYAISMVLAVFLCVRLRILPLIPSYTELVAYVLPAIVISLGGISSITRMTRTSLIEVLDQPFIIALHAKGLQRAGIIWRHAFKNALVPVISTIGLLITQLLCGTMVVEYFFNIPGLGTFMLRSVVERDHVAILACTIVMTVILSCTNTLSDICYSFINPQIRLRYAKTHVPAE